MNKRKETRRRIKKLISKIAVTNDRAAIERYKAMMAELEQQLERSKNNGKH